MTALARAFIFSAIAANIALAESAVYDDYDKYWQTFNNLDIDNLYRFRISK
jgi:hypothetical protein